MSTGVIESLLRNVLTCTGSAMKTPDPLNIVLALAAIVATCALTELDMCGDVVHGVPHAAPAILARVIAAIL